MPQVPVVRGPSVTLNAAPDVQQRVGAATPDAFGGVQARQLGQAAQGLAGVAEVLAIKQEKDDADSVFRAETALKTDYLAFEREELGRRGVDAKGAGERSTKWWEQVESKYSEGLTSNRSQRLFKRSAGALQMASSGTLMRHEQQQTDKSLQESAMARVATAIDTAIGDPTPERLSLARTEIESSIGVMAKLGGHTPEIAAAARADAFTKMHKGIVMNLADSDPDAAKAYFYTHKKEIAGPERVVIEKALEREGRLAKVQEAADEIVPKAASLSEALAYVQKNYSGEDEKALTQEVTARFHVAEKDIKDRTTKAFESAMLYTAQRQKVPANVWATLDDGDKARLLEHQRAVSRSDAAEARARSNEARGRETKTDFATYDRLNTLAGASPREFAQTPLGQFADQMSTADLKHFSNLQQKIRTGEDSVEVVSLANQLDQVVESMRLGGQNNSEKRGAFKSQVNQALMEAQREKGNVKLNYEERQKVIDRQVITVSVPGFLWDSEKRAFELTPEERAKAKAVVPDGDRKLITDALRTMKRPITEQAISDLYKRQKGIQ